MDTSELIAGLGKRLGIELAPDEDGACALEADGLAVVFNDLPQAGALALSCDLGEPPPERLEGLFRAMLEANHLFAGTAGATLSLDPATGRFSLCRVLPRSTLDADSLLAETERFVNAADAWSALVRDYRGAAAAPAAPAGPEPAADGPSASGFLQV